MAACHYILVRFANILELLAVLTDTPTPRRVLGNAYFNVVELMSAMLLIAQKFVNQENDKFLCLIQETAGSK